MIWNIIPTKLFPTIRNPSHVFHYCLSSFVSGEQALVPYWPHLTTLIPHQQFSTLFALLPMLMRHNWYTVQAQEYTGNSQNNILSVSQQSPIALKALYKPLPFACHLEISIRIIIMKSNFMRILWKFKKLPNKMSYKMKFKHWSTFS